MRQSPGFLTVRQRRFAWLGFLLVAIQAPVSASVLLDDSWLFSVVVAMMIAIVILADDNTRRRPATDAEIE